MTYTEAKAFFEECLWDGKCNEDCPECNAMEVVISAIERQIPKKPIDVCKPVVTWGLCPSCKGELCKLGSKPNRVFKSDAYCPDCGQALDWSDTE